MLLRLERRRARRSSPSPRSAPGARTGCSSRSTASAGALAWTSERPEELWLGHRDRPNELLLRDPALMSAAGAAAALPGRPRRGLRRDVPRALPGRLRARSPAGPPGDPDYPTFADGHDEAVIARRRSRQRPRGPLGRRRPHAEPPGGADEARPAHRRRSRTLRSTRSPTGRPPTASTALEVACWPRGRGRRAPLRGRLAHRRRDARPTRGAARSVDGLAPPRPRDLGARLLPEPARPRRRARARPRTRHLRKVMEAAAKLGVPTVGHVRGQRPAAAARRRTSSASPSCGRRSCATPASSACRSRSRTARCSSPTTSGRAATTSPTARTRGARCSPPSPTRTSASTSTPRTWSGR